METSIVSSKRHLTPYIKQPKYDLDRALLQGTLFTALDDHWQHKIEAFKDQFNYR